MRAAVFPSLLCMFLAACGDSPADPSAPGHTSDAEPARAPDGPHRVVVFATASLQRPFAELARRYERDHPGAKVELRCDGGAQLLAAMDAGEPCDVIAIGDSSQMSKFAAAAHLGGGSATELARNRIAIAVADGNPKGIRSVTDLARADIKVALGARSSSIGRHARWVLSRQQLDVKPHVEAATAAGVLRHVVDGNADAGIVYVTSFADGVATGIAADAVQRIELPPEQNTPVLYSIAAARLAPEPRGAAAFRALCLGATGQQILREAGFLPIGAKTD